MLLTESLAKEYRQRRVVNGVSIIGYTDLPSRMAHVASEFYGMNLWHLLDEMGGAANYKIDHENDAVRPALVLEQGEKRWPAPPMKKVEAPKPPPTPAKDEPKPAVVSPAPAPGHVKASGGGHGPPPAAPKTPGIVLAIAGLVAAAIWVYLRVSGVTVPHRLSSQ